MSTLTPRQMLDALDVVAQHVQQTILTVEAQTADLARQRLDLSLSAQRLEDLRAHVTAYALESERHVRTERRNIDSHGLAARVAGGSRLKAMGRAS